MSPLHVPLLMYVSLRWTREWLRIRLLAEKIPSCVTWPGTMAEMFFLENARISHGWIGWAIIRAFRFLFEVGSSLAWLGSWVEYGAHGNLTVGEWSIRLRPR
jgi:hypothetical protein